MGFISYYKIKLFVDDGMARYETWKYVFANSEHAAKEAVLNYYNSQYDTYAKIIDMYTYPVQDTMMFDKLVAI